jgi:hypothetical protein
MEVVNLTPHEVRIVDESNELIAAIPSSGVARATQQDVPAGSIEFDGASIPVVKTEFGGVELPEPTEGVVYIVSNITVQAAKAVGRSTADLLFPSGIPIRDAQGQIVGVRALARA